LTILEYTWLRDKAVITNMIAMNLLNEHFDNESMKENSVHENQIIDYHSLMAHNRWRRGYGGALRQVKTNE
jgi:hypothetical protein